MEALKNKRRREENPAASNGAAATPPRGPAAATPPTSSRSAAQLAKIKIKCGVERETGVFPTSPRSSPPFLDPPKPQTSPGRSSPAAQAATGLGRSSPAAQAATGLGRSSPAAQATTRLDEIKIQKETKPPAVRKREGGKKVGLELEKGKYVFEYEVKFSPPVHSKNEMLKCLKQHSNIIGPTQIFDGVVLNLHFELPENKTLLQTELPSDGSPVTVIITLKRRKKMGVRNCKEKITSEKIKEICDICGESVNTDKMSKHMKHVHAFKNVKNVPSTYCDKKITNEGEEKLCKNKDENENNGVDKYTCNICGFKIKDSWKLDRHKKTHSNSDHKDNAVYKYACQICKYKTDDKWKLDRHVKTHDGYNNWKTDPLVQNLAKQSNRKRKRQGQDTTAKPLAITDENNTVTKKKKTFSLNPQNGELFPMVDEINANQIPEQTKLVMKKLKVVDKKLPQLVNKKPEGISETSSGHNQNVDAAKDQEEIKIVSPTRHEYQDSEMNQDISIVVLETQEVIDDEIIQEEVGAAPTQHENHEKTVDKKNKEIETKKAPLLESQEILTGIPTRVIKYVKVPEKSTEEDEESDIEEIPRRRSIDFKITNFSIERVFSTCNCRSYKE